MKNRLTQQADHFGKTSFGTRVPHIERLSLRSRHRGVFLPGCRIQLVSQITPDARLRVYNFSALGTIKYALIGGCQSPAFFLAIMSSL